MSIRLPVELSVSSTSDAGNRGFSTLRHGELLVGKVIRGVSSAQPAIRFRNFDAEYKPVNRLQVGNRVFAYVQKNRNETLLSLLPNVREGEVLTGTVATSRSSQVLARFGESELEVYPPSPETLMPPAGTEIRAQLQVSGGRPVLRMLPENVLQSAVTGTVMSARPDGTVLLDTGGIVLVAEPAGDFEVGDDVQAAVRQIGDKSMLQILSKPSLTEGSDALAGLPETSGVHGKLDEALAKFLSASQYARLLEALVSGELKVDGSVRDLLLLLQQLITRTGAEKNPWILTLARVLETILLFPEREAFSDQLGNAFKDSGIFFESRLLDAALSQKPDLAISSDLKFALLVANREVSRMIPSAAAGPELPSQLSEIAAKIGQLLDTVTAEQFLNLRSYPSNQIYIQLPFASGADLDHVEIRISHHGKQSKRKIDPRNVLLKLAVTTSKLGRIKASLSIIDGQVSCQFKATRESVAELFANNVDVLKRGLEKLNYRVAYIGCAVSDDAREFFLSNELVATSQEGFDVRA